MLTYKYKSYAKVNLFLNIVGYSAGYHLLQSVFANVNIYDTISIKKSKKLLITYSGNYSHSINYHNSNNIINKTVNYFISNYNITPLNININKNIPVGSGLGGASSNCATLMLAINSIFNLNLSFNTLLDIAKNLGADVSFFLYNTPAYVQGFGQQVSPLQFALNHNVVVVFPNINNSTASIFSSFKQNCNFSQPINTSNFTTNNIFTQSNIIGNNLQSIVVKQSPIIKSILQALQPNALLCSLSGSGSACFAVYGNLQQASQAYNNIKQNFSNVSVYNTSFIRPNSLLNLPKSFGK